jgi:transketolase
VNSLKLAQKIRLHAVDLVYRAKASHIGGALSVTDILSVLYANILRYDSSNSAWVDRDRLLFSKGHCCTSLYAALHLVGFFPLDDLLSFATNGSYFTSHVNHNVPGIELSTGSLGHALPVACGMALAAIRKNKSWRVFVILSDGELDEGSNWESFLFAPHHLLRNLTVIIDYNRIQSFGTTKEVLDLDPLVDKLKAFRWNVSEIDGHNHDEVRKVLTVPPQNSNLPSAIIAHTIKGKGVSFMENQLSWHYRSPDEQLYRQAIREIEQQ